MDHYSVSEEGPKPLDPSPRKYAIDDDERISRPPREPKRIVDAGTNARRRRENV